MGVDIVFEIDELVLNGFPRVDRDRVNAAFRRELVRLLHAEPSGLLAAESDHSVDAVGLPALPPTTSSRRLGEVLARAVHTGISRP